MAAGMALYCLFAFVPALSAAGERLEPLLTGSVPLLLSLVLLLTFCRVDFALLRPARWHAAVTGIQVLLVCAAALAAALAPTPGWLIVAQCALMCVLCPCASASPVVTARLGGNLNEATAQVFISNFMAAVLIPVVFSVLESGNSEPFVSVFLRVLWRVGSVLVLPVAGAWAIRRYAARLHGIILRHDGVPFYLWSVVLAVVSGLTLRNIIASHAPLSLLAAIAAVSLAICAGQFAIGRWAGKRGKRTTEAGQGLGQKNTAFAIWASTAFLTPLTAVGPGCYILWQNLVNSLELWRHEKRKAANEA